MAQHHLIRTPRLTDRQIVDLLLALNDASSLTAAHITLLPGTPQIDVTSLDIENSPLVTLYENRHAISHVRATTRHDIVIQFFRGICPNKNEPTVNRQASPYFDELALLVERSRGTDEERIAIVECIDLLEQNLPRSFPIQDIDAVQNPIDVVQAELSSLGDVYKNLTSSIARERKSLNREFRDRRIELEGEFENKRNALNEEDEARRTTFEAEAEAKRGSWQEWEETLKRREGALDDREHTHVRRELRRQIASDYKTRRKEPAVSNRSRRMRFAVFGLTMLVGFGIGAYGFYSFKDLVEAGELYLLGNQTAPAIWMKVILVTRSTILLLLGTGFVALAINWLRRLYLDDVRAEREYESFGNDIDRASYVIETIMEVGEKEGAAVPNVWIEGTCRNLFSPKGDNDHGRVPSSAAAMLLETISGAKIGPDGTEVTVDRRGARRLGKQLKED